MNRRLRTSLLGIAISLSIISFTVAGSNIVDSMNFQGDGIELTLDKAVKTMLEDNPTIEQMKLSLEEADVQSKKIISNARDKKDEQAYEVKKSGEVIPLGDKYGNYKQEGSLDNIQVLKLPNLQSNYIKSNAERTYKATVESLKAGVEGAYFGLLQAKENEAISKDNMDIAKELYDQTKKKLDLGVVSKQQVLISEQKYVQSQSEYQSSVNGVKEAKMALNALLGYDVMTELKLKDKLSYKDYELGSIAEAVNKAFINRKEIKDAEYNYSLEQINLDIVSKKYPENTFAYREQKVKVDSALQTLESEKKDIEKDVRTKYLKVQELREKIKNFEKSVELAKESLRLQQLSYDVGMAVLTDVQKSQTSLKEAKLGLSNAILQYNLAILEYEDSLAVGRM